MDVGFLSARTTGRPVSRDTLAILNKAAKLLTWEIAILHQNEHSILICGTTICPSDYASKFNV